MALYDIFSEGETYVSTELNFNFNCNLKYILEGEEITDPENWPGCVIKVEVQKLDEIVSEDGIVYKDQFYNSGDINGVSFPKVYISFMTKDYVLFENGDLYETSGKLINRESRDDKIFENYIISHRLERIVFKELTSKKLINIPGGYSFHVDDKYVILFNNVKFYLVDMEFITISQEISIPFEYLFISLLVNTGKVLLRRGEKYIIYDLISEKIISEKPLKRLLRVYNNDKYISFIDEKEVLIYDFDLNLVRKFTYYDEIDRVGIGKDYILVNIVDGVVVKTYL